MKTKLTSASLAFLMLLTIAPTLTAAPEKGPLIRYLDCVDYCVESYGQWTVRRSACASDCYIGVVGSVIASIIGIR